MVRARSNFGAGVLEGGAVRGGGFRRPRTCSHVERYDEVWRSVCDMTVNRHALSCCVVAGLDDMAQYAFPRPALHVTRLRSVETYTPGSHTWLPAPSMVRARSNFGAGVLEVVLYVVGGFGGRRTCSHVERYDEVWRSVCDMTAAP
ncbi:hypothetical protein CRUP_004103 [Coryphaenoides rupestris]|nr:hypothetical protein CRUP_004103 [Coryphaenoides rupestris]